MRNSQDGRGPWGMGAASGIGDGASYSNAVPAGSPSLGRRVRAPSVPAGGRTSVRGGTKQAGKPYISPPFADTTDEGLKTETSQDLLKEADSAASAPKDYGKDGGQTDKEAVSQLVERARVGSSEAFGEIFRMYHEPLFRYARYRLGNREAAEDAVSETFARAFKNLCGYRPTGAPFVSWLYGIARHVVVDAGNAARRVEPRSEFADRAAEPGIGTVDKIELADAIAALPQKQRQVIEMKYFLGMNNEEVGAALGKTPGAVNVQQYRALKGLERLMERR